MDCEAKSIPEKKLKSICAEVLELDEFDEDVFTERVEQITVIGDDTLEFHFTDGSTLRKAWKSTAKTDWWTDERRREWGERHKNSVDDESTPGEEPDEPEVILGCKVVIRNEHNETKTYKYDLMNGTLPKALEVFTGHKAGDVIEMLGCEWKIEDVIF